MHYFPASVSFNYCGPYESDTFQTFPQLPFSAVPSEMTELYFQTSIQLEVLLSLAQ